MSVTLLHEDVECTEKEWNINGFDDNLGFITSGGWGRSKLKAAADQILSTRGKADNMVKIVAKQTQGDFTGR